MKKRLLRLAAQLYPAVWRDRYGVEFQALLDDVTPHLRDIVDVLEGGAKMRLRRTHPAVVVAAFSMAGAFGAGAIALNTADRFVSTSTIEVRPAVPSATSEAGWLDTVMPRLAREAFSPDSLTGIIQKHNLYHSESGQSSTDDLVNRVRGDIRMHRISRSVVQVSFALPDARRVQPVTNDLIRELVAANFRAGLASNVQVIDPPDEPRLSVSPHIAIAGLGGFAGGALIGTLVALLLRRRAQPMNGAR